MSSGCLLFVVVICSFVRGGLQNNPLLYYHTVRFGQVARSPSNALLPFWGRVPLLTQTTETKGHPYFNLSTGGPRLDTFEFSAHSRQAQLQAAQESNLRGSWCLKRGTKTGASSPNIC